jgi:hypothetical protein
MLRWSMEFRQLLLTAEIMSRRRHKKCASSGRRRALSSASLIHAVLPAGIAARNTPAAKQTPRRAKHVVLHRSVNPVVGLMSSHPNRRVALVRRDVVTRNVAALADLPAGAASEPFTRRSILRETLSVYRNLRQSHYQRFRPHPRL